MNKPELSVAAEAVQAGLITNRQSTESMGAGGVFTVTCVAPDGTVKWTDTFHNLVTSAGIDSMNNVYLLGTTPITTWYLGLVQGPGSGTTFAYGDTLATHGGWTELAAGTAYSGNRKLVTFAAPTNPTSNQSQVTNSASPASFTMQNTYTVAGALLCSVASGTSGLLFSAGDFTGGDKQVDSGDQLNVTYTFTLAAA